MTQSTWKGHQSPPWSLLRILFPYLGKRRRYKLTSFSELTPIREQSTWITFGPQVIVLNPKESAVIYQLTRNGGSNVTMIGLEQCLNTCISICQTQGLISWIGKRERVVIWTVLWWPLTKRNFRKTGLILVFGKLGKCISQTFANKRVNSVISSPGFTLADQITTTTSKSLVMPKIYLAMPTRMVSLFSCLKPIRVGIHILMMDHRNLGQLYMTCTTMTTTISIGPPIRGCSQWQ
jgi:hypothetical protein